eukprot:gene19210-27213_t
MGATVSVSNSIPDYLDEELCRSLFGDKFDEKKFYAMKDELKASAREQLKHVKGFVQLN